MTLAVAADNTTEPGSRHDIFTRAFSFERASAMLLDDLQVCLGLPDEEVQPTRAILFRSAVSLAIEAHDLPQAKRMIELGLKHGPPAEIESELRILNERIIT